MERQEGYYWVKIVNRDKHEIVYFQINQKMSRISTSWYLVGDERCYFESDFEHINENKIKEPGELPD
jgi:hypothetical protein